MDSAFIHQAANELVKNAGTRNIKQIARSCSLDISETSRIKDMLGLLSLYFDKPLILINRQLDKQTKQMVCGYALGHYLEHQLLMDLHTLNKFLTIKDKHILLYEHNAFTSHLMLDSDEVYQMTKRGLDAAQISVAKRIHLNLVMVKLLELHHLGYDLRHYHAQHHAFIEHFRLPASLYLYPPIFGQYILGFLQYFFQMHLYHLPFEGTIHSALSYLLLSEQTLRFDRLLNPTK